MLMQMLKLNFIILLAALAMTFSLAVPAAADCGDPATAKEAAQCGADNAGGKSEANPNKINNTITEVINVLTTIVGIVAVVMIIFAGYRYITSGGNSEKVNAAKSTLLYAIIGL